jgi:hypothetical protein
MGMGEIGSDMDSLCDRQAMFDVTLHCWRIKQVELDDCKTLAIMLMGQYHLEDWKFEFDYHNTRFGLCNYRTKTISMSRFLTYMNDVSVVQDTILHEIAHALAPYTGHGPRWRQVCRAIGCKPRACYSLAEVRH